MCGHWTDVFLTVPAAPQISHNPSDGSIQRSQTFGNLLTVIYLRSLIRTTKFGMVTRRPSEGRVLGVSHDPSQSRGPNDVKFLGPIRIC